MFGLLDERHGFTWNNDTVSRETKGFLILFIKQGIFKMKATKQPASDYQTNTNDTLQAYMKASHNARNKAYRALKEQQAKARKNRDYQ